MASRYWVGGTGNWDASTTTNWAATSGGVGGSSVPTSSDDVIFDTLSNTTGYTVTVTATANCANITIGAPLTGALTFAGSSGINIFGNFSVAGTNVTWTNGGIFTFSATSGTKTITTNGLALTSSMTFSGSGGTFQLVDDLRINTRNNALIMTAGVFDPNGKTVTLAPSSGTSSIQGSFTFYNLTITSPSGKTNIFNFSANVTITNNLIINGNSVTDRVLVSSSTRGTSRTITAANVTITNADFMDITGAGAGSWNLSAITGNSGDCGGNSGITFTTPATQTASGTASFTWSTHSWTSRVPLPQDDVVINNAFIAGRTITVDMPRIGKNITCNCTGSPTLTNSAVNELYGSLDLTGIGAISGTNTLTCSGRGSFTIKNAGLTYTQSITINAPGGTYTLSDAINGASTQILTLTNGTFNANNFNVTFGKFSSSNSNVRTITMGSGIWTITGSGNGIGAPWVVQILTNLTFNANTSTIKFTDNSSTGKDFLSGGLTYNNIWFTGSGTGIYQVFGSNTFNDFRDDNTSAHSIIFSAGATQHVTSFSVNGSSGNSITLNSSTTGIFSLVKDGTGVISCDWLNIQHCVATPSSTWYAGANSVNNQATSSAGSGWIFTVPPGGQNSNLLSLI